MENSTKPTYIRRIITNICLTIVTEEGLLFFKAHMAPFNITQYY